MARLVEMDVDRRLMLLGCRWRALTADFPPSPTDYCFFRRWTKSGVWDLIRDHLRRAVRCMMGTSPHAVATVLDSQSVKASETVSADSRGWDGGKMINGRKRHLLAETHGLPLEVMVTSAGLHDSKPAKELLIRADRRHPELAIVWADSAYRGPFAQWAKSELKLTIRTASRPEGGHGFVVLPRRWVVERSWAWVMHARRLVRDHERLPESAEAMLTIASITLMTRRLERVRALGMRGKVTISHAYELGNVDEATTRRLIVEFAELDISTATIAPAQQQYALPLADLTAAGVRIGLGEDGQRDWWSPYGNGDMLDHTRQLASTNRYRFDELIEHCWAVAGRGGATIMDPSLPRLTSTADRPGVDPGDAADLVLVEGDAVTAAIMDRSSDRTVLRAGRVVADGLTLIG